MTPLAPGHMEEDVTSIWGSLKQYNVISAPVLGKEKGQVFESGDHG